MKALVIYDSLYGSTETIARAIVAGIASSYAVKELRAGDVKLPDLDSIDLLIVGSPVHGGKPTRAIRDMLARIPAGALKNVSVAAFDTRIRNVVASLFGYAAGDIADGLKKQGGRLVAPPEGFIVKGIKGPLKEGEAERAAGWGKAIISGNK